MSSEFQITLRPTPTYLFSYLWLSIELILFTLIIERYFDPYSLIAITVFMLFFARLYYWLNFSPETGVQTIFIVGVIPFLWIIDIFDKSSQFLTDILFYTVFLLLFGLFRVLFIRYQITNSMVTFQLLSKKSFEIDHSRPIKMYQHKRGKKLNFGCITIPVISTISVNKNLIISLLLHQRSHKRYFNTLRIDGIRNPQQTLRNLKTQYKYEKN
jgi:hypothetical protein